MVTCPSGLRSAIGNRRALPTVVRIHLSPNVLPYDDKLGDFGGGNLVVCPVSSVWQSMRLLISGSRVRSPHRAPLDMV